MNRILIFLIFVSQVVFGQSKIQHEPERLFNQLDLGMSRAEYVKKHQIQKITFLRDTTLSSMLEFDTNGNRTLHIGMENNSVRKSTFKYDDQNRVIETKHFDIDDNFNYGYYYRFENGLKVMYKLKDSLLFRKSAYLEPENIRIYSEYNEDGTLKLKNFYVFDSEDRYLLETRFSPEEIKVQYRFEYLDNEKYVTKIQYDQNGTKISEKRHLDERKLPNEQKVNHYRDDDETIFRTDFLDEYGNVIKMELYDNDDQLYREERKEYNSHGQLKYVTKENYKKQESVHYEYVYDKENRLKTILKTTDGITENFEYRYIIRE